MTYLITAFKPLFIIIKSILKTPNFNFNKKVSYTIIYK